MEALHCSGSFFVSSLTTFNVRVLKLGLEQPHQTHSDETGNKSVQTILEIGDSYQVQLVWKLPDFDFMRAVYQVTVCEIDRFEERYLVKIDGLAGGVQEAPDGSPRPPEEMTKQLWRHVVDFVGNYIRLPYESTDGRPLHLKFATLSGQHSFFTRHNPDTET